MANRCNQEFCCVGAGIKNEVKSAKKGRFGLFSNSGRAKRITVKITQQPLCEKIHNLDLNPNSNRITKYPE